jgi:uncharacterized protein YceK
MRYMVLIFLVASLLLSGCAENRGAAGNTSNTTMQGNATQNATQNTSATQNASQNLTQNETQNLSVPAYNRSKDWSRFSSKDFSFEAPASMNMSEVRQGSGGVITGERNLPERTAEILTIRYLNVSWTYSKNRDEELKSNPTKAAADFLAEDKKNDTMGFFMKASSMGDISTFAIGRDVYIAEMPFMLRMNSDANYTGYAMDIYVPERSLRIDVRILALDPATAKSIRDNFLLSFGLE